MSEPTTLNMTTLQMGLSDPPLPTTTPIVNNTTSSNFTVHPTIATTYPTEVYAVLLGVSSIAFVVMILIIMLVVLRFMAHQKGTYYTREETLAFKSDPDVQEITDDMEDPEDAEDPNDPEDAEDAEDAEDSEDPEEGEL